MPDLLHFMRCIGRAVIKNGAKALASAIPFGEVVYEIATDAYQDYRKDHGESDLRADIQGVVQATPAQVRQATEQAVAQVAADQPPEIRLALATYLNQMPAAIRQSLRRPADPIGATVPPARSLSKPEDLLQFLPQRLPRFKPGDRPLVGVDRELVKLLGVGGFGEVWRARNPHVPAMPDVALKFCLDPMAREQLLKYEANLLGRVMSQGPRPGIVPLRQTYLSAETPCLEYEFIDGGDLTSAIYSHQANKGHLTPDMTHKIVLHLARAVAQLHKLSPPIVHRDLKPANVLVRTRDGKTEFLITDFGIGGVVASQALEQTRSGTTRLPMITSVTGACTLLYASPEQKRREGPDPRDDVHALGVIWYQLLVGDFNAEAPHGGAWRKALAQRGLSDSLLHLLESCFETEAKDRPPNAGAVAERIEAIIAEKKAAEQERLLREQESERRRQEEEARAVAELKRLEHEEARRRREEEERLRKEQAAREEAERQRLEEVRRQEELARQETERQRHEDERRQNTPDRAALRDLLDNAPRFFVCNTNRKYSRVEGVMRQRRYAAVWETFAWPAHMELVREGDAIFMWASGGVGVIGIGRASGQRQILEVGDPDRVRSDAEHDGREWRIPVEEWLVWVDRDRDACPFKTPIASFINVSGGQYSERRVAVRQHFLGESPGTGKLPPVDRECDWARIAKDWAAGGKVHDLACEVGMTPDQLYAALRARGFLAPPE